MSVKKTLIKAFLQEEKAEESIREERLKRCFAPCLWRDEDKCIACGCFVELKAGMDKNRNPKALFRIEKTHCPRGKWPYIDEEGNYHDNDIEIANYYRKIDGKKLLNNIKQFNNDQEKV